MIFLLQNNFEKLFHFQSNKAHVAGPGDLSVPYKFHLSGFLIKDRSRRTSSCSGATPKGLTCWNMEQTH